MRLSTRLLLIVLTSLLPIIAIAVWAEYSHWSERRAQLGDLALQQAQLLNGDLESITHGARVLLTTAAEFPELRQPGRNCEERLKGIQRDVPMFAFLAVLDGHGEIVCSSRSGLRTDGALSPWIKDAVAASDFSVGRYATAVGLHGGFLPFALPLSDQDPGQHTVLVTGLDLDWLSQHLQALRQSGSRFLADSVLSVADGGGVILARSPQHGEFTGMQFPTAVMPLVNAAEPGIARVRSVDGTNRVVGYIPASRSRHHLMVSIGFYEPEMMGDINHATLRGGALLAAAAIGAFLLTLFVARRFIGRPTRELLEAARRWREGDPSATAFSQDQHSEFGQIAAAYHAMATALSRREEVLEARVAERTDELLVSNNRLQVEIAERQNTEAALVQSQKLQAVGQLAGGIAHDFNNLLATIQGSLDLLAQTLPEGQARQHRWIDRASGAVHRGSQLTGRLLAFSRRQRLAVAASDVNKLVADLVPLLQTATHGHRIRVDTDLAKALWPAMIEPSQVEAAILNLALNARDAMPEGGTLTIVTANQTISNDPREDIADGDYVAITVRDTGIGMSDEVARRAFEPFFTTKGLSGSGLGLSQVYGMVHESAGAVRLTTLPGEGTSVTLLLPRALEMPRTVRPRAMEKRAQSQRLVLAVDDDTDVLQVTAEMLRQLGYAVAAAGCGEEALSLMEREPAIVMLDFAMPGMTGLETAAEMRTRGFVGPIILATGYAELSKAEQLELSRLQGVLNKPYTIRDLEGLLARIEETMEQSAEAPL